MHRKKVANIIANKIISDLRSKNSTPSVTHREAEEYT